MKPVFGGVLIGAVFALAANVLMVLSLMNNGPFEGPLFVAASIALIVALVSLAVTASLRAPHRGRHPSRGYGARSAH